MPTPEYIPMTAHCEQCGATRPLSESREILERGTGSHVAFVCEGACVDLMIERLQTARDGAPAPR